MNRDQVQTQEEFGPYYSFKNGDLGSQAGPFRDRRVPISFYFSGDRLVRVMLIAYSGGEVEEAKRVLMQAVAQLTQEFGGVELPETEESPATTEAVLAAFDASVSGLAQGRRFQTGAFPMPSDRKAWVSVTLVQEGLYMVAINYAEP